MGVFETNRPRPSIITETFDHWRELFLQLMPIDRSNPELCNNYISPSFTPPRRIWRFEFVL
jgi:hypothetical protein